jgi:N-acetylglucosamine malate deacetylase 1
MKVLVIAPHPDDEALGCGGAICLHRKRGDRVAAIFLTSGELGLKELPAPRARRLRENEARRAAKILNLDRLYFLRFSDWALSEQLKTAARRLREVFLRERPELIYLPHPGEWHPDHPAALPILQAALRRTTGPKPILYGYEIWTPLADYDQVEDVSGFMARKLRALRAHRSQVKGWDYVRAITGLNQYRGVMAGRCRFAEVFQTLVV